MASPPGRSSDAAYYLLAVVAGALVGLVGTVFHIAADALLHGFRAWVGEMPAHQAVGVAGAAGAAMVTTAVLLVRAVAPAAAGSGVQEIEGALEGVRPLDWRRILPVKFAGGVLAIGSGLVVGREGPTIHMGAAISAGFAERLGLDDVDRRGLIAAGAAAGLAAAFNAPVAAVLFVVEETRRQFPYTARTYCGVIFASVASTVVTEEIAGVAPDLRIEASVPGLELLAAFALFGVVLGGVGVLFNRLLVWTLDGFDALARLSPLLGPVAVGGLLGVLAVTLPAATGGGESLIRSLVAESFAPAALAGLLALRLATTLVSYSVGAPGGIFAPILTLATLGGLAFANLAALVLPVAAAGHGAAFAIAGMAGLFAASVRAPMVAVVLVAELTGAYGLLLPVLVTAVVAFVVARALGGEPIYETLLARTLRRAGGPSPPTAASVEAVPLELGASEQADERPVPPRASGKRDDSRTGRAPRD